MRIAIVIALSLGISGCATSHHVDGVQKKAIVAASHPREGLPHRVIRVVKHRPATRPAQASTPRNPRCCGADDAASDPIGEKNYFSREGRGGRQHGFHHHHWNYRSRLRPDNENIKALQPVYFATNRKVVDKDELKASSFTTGRSREVTYGVTVVSVPKSHVLGNVERPDFHYLGWRYDEETDAHDFRLRSIESLTRDELVESLQMDSNSVLLFIHGYNVPFQDAIFKAAQIAYDANFPGSVLVFSWPSAGALLGYDYDVGSARFSAGDLLKLLRMLTEEVGDKKIYVVAHSLGNEVLVDALEQAALSKVRLTISELVMAAPDVDKDVFGKMADDIKAVATNMTMYASSVDKALRASKRKAWVTRMGYIDAGGPNLIDGIETIDVTAVGDDMIGLNHGTYASSRAVLDDLARIISSDKHEKPHLRTRTLKFVPDEEHVKYWVYPR